MWRPRCNFGFRWFAKGVCDSALTGYRDVLVAAAVPTGARGFGNRIRHLVGPDALVSDSLCKITRPAVGVRGVRAAAFTLGKALVDAVSIGLVGNDEHAAVRPCGGRKESQACQNRGKNPKRGENIHWWAGKERAWRESPRRMLAISRQNKAFVGRGLDALSRLLHGNRMHCLLAICGICREITA